MSLGPWLTEVLGGIDLFTSRLGRKATERPRDKLQVPANAAVLFCGCDLSRALTRSHCHQQHQERHHKWHKLVNPPQPTNSVSALFMADARAWALELRTGPRVVMFQSSMGNVSPHRKGRAEYSQYRFTLGFQVETPIIAKASACGSKARQKKNPLHGCICLFRLLHSALIRLRPSHVTSHRKLQVT